MENQRLLLYFTLFFIIYLLWAEWQMDYGPKPEATVAETTTPAQQEIAEVPEAAATPDETSFVESSKQQQATSQRINVITDVLDIEIDTKGGDIRKAVLRNYSKTAENPEEKLVLMSDADIDFFIAQSGLVSVNADRHQHIIPFTLQKKTITGLLKVRMKSKCRCNGQVKTVYV